MLLALMSTVSLFAAQAGPPASAAAAPAKTDAARAERAFSALSDAAVADLALKALEATTTMKGEFTQTAPSGAISTGRFFLRRPGQIRFDFNAPSPLTIVATSGVVYVRDNDLEETDSYPLKKTPLKYLLSKRIDLKDARLDGVRRSADSVAVSYVSDDEELEGRLTLVLSAPDLALKEWMIEDAQGGATVVSLRKVAVGEALDSRLFRAPRASGG